MWSSSLKSGMERDGMPGWVNVGEQVIDQSVTVSVAQLMGSGQGLEEIKSVDSVELFRDWS